MEATVPVFLVDFHFAVPLHMCSSLIGNTTSIMICPSDMYLHVPFANGNTLFYFIFLSSQPSGMENK
jgi:hypothetical protein